MKNLLIATEPKWFCFLIVAFLFVFKTKIFGQPPKKQLAAYVFAFAGILVSALSDFSANNIFNAVCYIACGICFFLCVLFVLEKEKPIISLPVSLLGGFLSFLSLSLRFNVITFAIALLFIATFALELYNQIRIDRLTKLYNRYGMDVELREQLRQYKQDKNDSFYIIACDLDKFKSINDTWGHLEGDRALMLVAEVLSRVAKKFKCEVFRIGGDEFIIITDKSDSGLADEITKALEIEFDNIHFRDDFDIEMSIGVALYDGVSTVDELLNSADKRLYEAKRR